MVDATLALFCPLSLFLPLGPCLLPLWLSFLLHTHAQRPLLCGCYIFYTRMLACLTTQAPLWGTAPAAAANPASAGRKSPDARAAPFHGPWETSSWTPEAQSKRFKGEHKSETQNQVARWHSLPERSWRTAHSASGPPSRAPGRSGAGTRTRCNALQRPAPGPGLIWPVSLKENASLFSRGLRLPFWKKISLTELTGADFSPSLWISQVLSPSYLLPRLCWTESFLLTSHDYYPLSLSNLFPFLLKGHHLYKAVKCLFFCPKF